MIVTIVRTRALRGQGFSANMRQVMVSERFRSVRDAAEAAVMFARAAAVIAVLASLMLAAAVGGCAKPAPPGLATADATAPAGPTAEGEPVPKGQSAEGVPVRQRGGYWALFYRHKDGDKAFYRVSGTVRKSRKLTVSYRFRGLKLPDGQIATVLMVRRDYGDDSPLTTFLLEDETSGTTREIGRQDPGSEVIVFYDPPPVTLDWAKAAVKGFKADVPYQPVIVEDLEPRSAGEMVVDTFEALGRESLTVKDATGTAVRFKDCLKWRVRRADGAVVTQWFGDIGEVVRQETRLPGGKSEREELIRVVRR